MAMGLNWYLKHYCHAHVSWYGNQLDLPDPLPPVEPKVRNESAGPKHRYFLNYCCFGYSLPWWDWTQWERLIDWMALNGINAPLAVTGQEAVWQAVGEKLGLSDEQMRAFLAGPPFLPFGWMGCLDGWGGPSRAKLDRPPRGAGQKKILERERALGMTPVLQGLHRACPPGVGREVSPSQAPSHPLDRVGRRTCSIPSTRCLAKWLASLWRSRPSDSARSPLRGRHLHRDDPAQRRTGVSAGSEPGDLRRPGQKRSRRRCGSCKHGSS